MWEADQDHAAEPRIIPTPQTANKASQGQKLEKSSSFRPFRTISARVLHVRAGKLGHQARVRPMLGDSGRADAFGRAVPGDLQLKGL